MTLAAPYVTIDTKDGGLSAGAQAPQDGVFWVFGMASQGPFTPFTTSSASDFKSTFGHGDGVEGALYALNNETRQITFVRVDPANATAGAYGAITVAFQGAGFTATGDVAARPADDTNPVVEFLTGGTIGVAGITYRYSLDGGNKYSGTRELGTDTSITLPYGAGKYDLVGLELTKLLARLVDIRTQFLAHTAEVGAYHTVVDPAAPYTVATPIDDATILTCCANLRTSALTHVATVAGTHGVADATASTALTALAVPTTRAEAIVFTEAFASIFFGTGTANSGHSIRVTSAIHTAPDAVNVLTAPAAIAGDVVAGDTFTLETTAPRWHIDKLIEALQKARDSSLSMNGVAEIVGRVLLNSEADAIETAAADIASKFRDVRLVGHYRMRNTGESLQAYGAAFAAAHPLASSSGRLGRLTLCASMYLSSQLNAGAIMARPASFAFAPRLARVGYSVNPINFDGYGTLKGAIRASNGEVLARAVDESFAEVCTPVRLWAPMTRPSGIQPSVAVTIAPDDSDYNRIENGRVVDAVRKAAHILLDRRLGQGVSPKPGTVYIDPKEAERIDGGVTKELKDVFVGDNRVHAERVYTVTDLLSVVSGPSPHVVKMSIFVVPKGSIDAIEATISLALG